MSATRHEYVLPAGATLLTFEAEVVLAREPGTVKGTLSRKSPEIERYMGDDRLAPGPDERVVIITLIRKVEPPSEFPETALRRIDL